MKEDIKFLKELQNELNTQDHDAQAAPRYWTVGDYKMVNCPEGCHEEYYISAPNRECFEEIELLIKEIKKEKEKSLSFNTLIFYSFTTIQVSEW